MVKGDNGCCFFGLGRCASLFESSASGIGNVLFTVEVAGSGGPFEGDEEENDREGALGDGDVGGFKSSYLEEVICISGNQRNARSVRRYKLMKSE